MVDAETNLESKRIHLKFWQAIWTTLITGGVAVAIPAAVEAYKAHLEVKRAAQETKLKEKEIELKDKEIKMRALDVHQDYISKFIDTALDQNIERRLRFAEYFSYVSDSEHLTGWKSFYSQLEKRRDVLRDDISGREQVLEELKSKRDRTSTEEVQLGKIERELDWKYAEIGYQRRDSNVIPVKTPATTNVSFWQTGVVSVCWENPSEADTADRVLVQQAIDRTWAANSKLRFSGWSKCDDKQQGVRIRISDEPAMAKAIGSALNGVRDGVIINFAFKNWNASCQNARESCIKSSAVHVFGHVLGFQHEHERSDAPAECKARTGYKTEYSASLILAPYDQSSVMNYCNPIWNNDGNLSSTDILKLNKIYGQADTNDIQ